MYYETRLIYRCVDALFRHRWAFLIALISISTLPVAFMQLRGKTYTASASIQVTTEDVAAVLGEAPRNNSWTSPAQQNINQFNDYMTDDRPGGFLDRALKQAKLIHPLVVDPRLKNPRFERLRKGISVTPTSDTVFSIGLVWDDAGECERILSALQRQYIEQVGMSRQAESLAATHFLDKEIAGYAERMRNSEQALIHYRQTHSGQSPEAQSDDLNQVSLLKSQLDSLQVDAHTADLKRQAMQERILQIRLSVHPTTVQETAPSNSQLQGLLDQRLALLAQDWLPSSDRVKELDAQIASLQQEAARTVKPKPKKQQDPIEGALRKNEEYQTLRQQLSDTVIESRSQQAQIQLLQQKIASYQARIRNNPSAESELNDRTRDYSSLKTQYEDLVKRREQAQLKANLDKISASSTLRPIGALYAQPTSSKAKTLILCLGLVMVGLIVGCLLVLAGEWSDSSLRYEADAERLLGVPVLAGIPQHPKLRFVPRLSDAISHEETSGEKERLRPVGSGPASTEEAKGQKRNAA